MKIAYFHVTRKWLKTVLQIIYTFEKLSYKAYKLYGFPNKVSNLAQNKIYFLGPHSRVYRQ
jgi:hypothetical protein